MDRSWLAGHPVFTMASWQGVETRHLAALVAVDREGSFRRAAASLGYAQSAISQRVAQLERIVGLRVLERSRGSGTVELTDAGRRLARHADRIITELDAAVADLRGCTNGSASTLRVGSYETVSTRLVPPALARLSKRVPDLRVVLHEDSDWERFPPLVANCALDAAFVELPLPDGPFASREIVRDPYTLLVPADSPLVERSAPPALEELGSLPLVVESRIALRRIRAHLRAAGVDPRHMRVTRSGANIEALVAEGVGAALVSRLAVGEPAPGVAAIDLAGIVPPRRICLCWHRHRRSDELIQGLVNALVERDETAVEPLVAPEPVPA
jgi:DNA-binding transcriptional LysR family regulator